MIASTLVLIAAAISGVRGVGEEKIDPISMSGVELTFMYSEVGESEVREQKNKSENAVLAYDKCTITFSVVSWNPCVAH